MPDLLYEIGAEEIPAGYIGPALGQLERALQMALDEARLKYGATRVTGTPRRLVVSVADVDERQSDNDEEIIGPPATVAFDADGNPTRAAHGFASSQGVDVKALQRCETGRGTYCCVHKHVVGRSAVEILAEVLPRITLGISFPKSMVWLSGERTFARPLRSLLALFGDEVIPFELFGVKSGRTAEGHPILSPGRIEIPNADLEQYKALLRERCVIVDTKERTNMIWKGINELPGTPTSEATKTLVDEVVNLVQYPSVSRGNFDPAFLEIPAPVIEAAMMEHQRYFPLVGPGDKLRPGFFVVSDRGPHHSDVIRVGNERVLHARLADARFFDQQDRKLTLEERVPALSGVAFLKGLGTYADKSRRLEKLARQVSAALGLEEEATAHAARAARLCKADLITEMVGEFPRLQGVIGRVYALREGEPEPVAQAIEEHYLPRSADGELPESPAGRALGLAEKLDNLASCFALGLIPTGSADPYALRRQAQAALRILEECKLHLDVFDLIREALALLPEPHCRCERTVPKLREFLQGRLFVVAIGRSYPHDLINAALQPGFGDVVDFWMRLEALEELSAKAAWQDLVIAVERTYNISKSAAQDDDVVPAFFTEPLEKELWSLAETHQAEIERLQDERQYVAASLRYAEVFARPLHQFFEDVFVNVEDEKVRNNRLQLVRHINRLYSKRIADLSQIVTGVDK